MIPRLASLVALSLIALAAAGCGGSGPPSVAQVATAAADATTTTGDAPSSGGAPSNSRSSDGGGGGGATLTMKTTNGTKFAACMRSHGVPKFPDPNASGEISIGPGTGVDPDSPKFRAAQDACQKELPKGGQPSPAAQAKAQQAALAFSRCMRAHGVHDFPDPQFSGGRVTIGVKGGAGSDLDPHSPTFKRAQEACRGQLPKLDGGPTVGGSTGK